MSDDDESYEQPEILTPRNDLFDDGGALKYIYPMGFYVPLRLTRQEWEEYRNFDVGFETVTFQSLFTMMVSVKPIPGTLDHLLGYQFEIACPRGTPPHVVFGPYREKKLAEKKALAYLLKAGVVELIDEVEKR